MGPVHARKISAHCGQNGRRVPLVTLKSLLKPAALATLEPDRDYAFCPNP
nr:hypothetical protein [Insulibacter thermoxylanivorax]